MGDPVQIRLVIFDWAGTVLDFGCFAPMVAFMQVFADRGVPVSLQEARRPMGTHKRDHLREMLENTDTRQRWRQKHGRDWSEDEFQAMYRDLVPLQLANIEHHSELVPGLLEAVAELRRMGLRIGGTTGYFREAASLVALAGQRQGYVPEVNLCADDVPAGRPAPWMIYRTMEQLSIYPPGAVLKVGDTVIDVQEGRNAGVWSAGVLSSSSDMGLTLEDYRGLTPAARSEKLVAVGRHFSAAGAHALIESLHEMPGLVYRLNERLARGERP